MNWEDVPEQYRYMTVEAARELLDSVFEAVYNNRRAGGFNDGADAVLSALALAAGEAWFNGQEAVANSLRSAHAVCGKTRLPMRPLPIGPDLAVRILECAAADVAAWPGPREGVLRIAAERAKQAKKGYDADHDADHDCGKLAFVAGELALAASDHVVTDPKDPWGLVAEHRDDPLRQLVIAGALIAAEIERRLREADAAELASSSSVEDSVVEAVAFCADLVERSKEPSDEEGDGVAMTDAEKRTVPMSRATERELARRDTRLGAEERSDDRQEGAS